MSAFLLLWREALGDAVRRKLVGAIAVASLLSLLVLDNCAGCAPTVMVNGEPRELASMAGALGIALFVVVGLWVVTLAGLLASDHLTQALEDGHATSALARPVSRHAFAFARLAGGLSVALVAGLVLLGTTGFWLATRASLPGGPALLAGLACGIAALTAAAFAMAASLALPRLATWLFVFAAVFATTLAAGASALPAQAAEDLARAFPNAWAALSALDRFGPPVAGAMLRALAPWLPGVPLPVDFAAVLARGVLWAALGLGALAASFRRIELR